MMQQTDVRQQWEAAAPGWSRWEPAVATWMQPATEAMLDLAGVGAGARVLDLASGAGSQALDAARRVGQQGHVVASDISDKMLQHVRENARAAGLANVTTLVGAAEELDLPAESFDAATCRLGLMLFLDPAGALAVVRRALRPGAKVGIVVFSTPPASPFMAQTMRILLRHTGKTPPAGGPGIFSLGAPGTLEQLLTRCGFTGVVQHTLTVSLRLRSATEALTMMQEAFGAYRAVLADSSESVREAAWAEVAEALTTCEGPEGFVAAAEVLVAAGAKPA